MDTQPTRKYPRDLGVLATSKQVLLYTNLTGNHTAPFQVGASSDGLNFRKAPKTPSLYSPDGAVMNTSLVENFRAAPLQKGFAAFFKYHAESGSASHLARSKDGLIWETSTNTVPFHETAMLVPSFLFNNASVAYVGDTEIRLATSNDLATWDVQSEPLLRPRHTHFDKHPLEVGSVILTEKGIVVIYFVKSRDRGGNQYSVGAALFDKNNPGHLLWRSDTSIWDQNEHWEGKTAYPMGAVHFKEKFIVYFGTEGEAVHAVYFNNLHDLLQGKGVDPKPSLAKSQNNPIITPVMQHLWEASSVFNSAAVYEDGKVHFVYRAMGPANTSVLGYATSTDGESIDERSDEPIYVPTEPFELPGKYPSINFMSGGGYGGCEDPRITKVDDTFYMTYVAYNGEDPPRVALTSIKVKDFLEKSWNKWAKPKLISKPGVVNKNCVIFPEKINGKYVVIHRVFPDVLIDYVDDLDFDDKYLEGHYKISPRDNAWDSRKLGAGAPPLKTKDGWLLIYQAVDDRDPGKYKIGAMLLDLKDPSKVLYRSNNPILEPTEWYENEGFKAGVAYPCGAVIMDNKLVVYYGGADTVICAASAPLDGFLEELKHSSPTKLQPHVQPKQILKHFNYAYAN